MFSNVTLRKIIPITIARKINHMLNNVKEYTTITYFRVREFICYQLWNNLGRQGDKFKLFDIYRFSNLPINQIDEQPWKEINDKYE